MKIDDRLKELAKSPSGIQKRGATNAVIYTRVSSKEQAENNASLDTQKRYCEELAKRRGLDIVSYFGGTYESAKSDERKEFKRMLEFVRRNKQVSFILVYAYDRFSRTGANGAYISEQLKQRGIAVLSVTQEVDTKTASGSFQQNLYYMFSQFDNQVRKDRMVAGFREKLRNGYWPLPVPIGFTNMNRGKRADQHDIVVDETGKILRKAWQWKLKSSLQNKQIVERLRSAGVNMSEKKLSKIFRNPFYCGLIATAYIEGEVIEGKHEAMVPKEEFFAVIDLLNGKFEKGRHSQENADELPLRRFVHCSECGAPYTGYLQKQKKLYYYRCRTTGCCKNRSQKKMHRAFLDFIAQYEVEEKCIPHLRHQLRYVFQEQNQSLMEEAEAIKSNLRTVEGKVAQLEERFALGEVGKEIFDKFHGSFIKERDSVLEKLEFLATANSNLEKCIEWVVDQCGNLSNTWASSVSSERLVMQHLIFPEGISYDYENERFLTKRVNTLFAPIPELKGIVVKKKKGSKEINSFDPLLRRVRDSNSRYLAAR
jgi:site-specific DNA recombinase